MTDYDARQDKPVQVIRLAGPAHAVFVKVRLIAHYAGSMTLKEYAGLQGKLREGVK